MTPGAWTTASALLAAVACAAPLRVGAETITAASCAQHHVEAAIAAAAAGDTVRVPAGSCAWSGLAITRAIHLRGAGVGRTNITVSASSVTKQGAGVTRISGFSFSRSGGGNQAKAFTIDGPWQGAEPVVFERNRFTVENSGLFLIRVAGGVIVAHNEFTGGWDDSFLQLKDDQDAGASWLSADTLGVRDGDGSANHYIESNVFHGGTNQGIDCDDASRCVYRFNTLTYSSFNTHGQDTSPIGIRHFEVYANRFVHDGGASPLANQNWALWIRGGTGVIFDNEIADLAGSHWGDKPEIKLSIRGAEDARPQGSCASVAYPVPRQLGQNHDGVGAFTDPIYLWGNVGAQVVDAGWNWGNPCGFAWAEFFQWGRDAVVSVGPKPGYAPFPHPHPLVVPEPGPASTAGALLALAALTRWRRGSRIAAGLSGS